MFLRIEETPNPNTLKFIPEKNIDFEGTKLFKSTDNFENSELLKTIFAIQGVTDVLLNAEFISISKSEKEDWKVLKTILTAKIGTVLQKKNIPFEEKASDNDNKKAKKKIDDPAEREIVNLLETKVKPVVASHGGDITFHSFENGVVTLELKGSCSGCPSSTATLKMGIENMLKHYIPDVKEVVELQSK
ncbi:MAG: Fe/S biogenesis protein NfuA [Alphaproteobacteria bacterium MarineAlpha9_Bin4]|nr:NifU family protein [Pelagibacterales bacterium]PPR26103.1 MAG: Fe/S biogenesis protein NfuA [Alphaproteobacteria bacterium MarineAlpha9_Bin4]|tara:strand:+ start:1144 stop:1710 length:567 start_codon:yes stop_codon:yes gene_type:complete